MKGIIRWRVFKQLTKFTYSLETDDEDRMGWSDDEYSNNWPSWRTGWRQRKRMMIRGHKSIDLVHVRSAEDGWRGWNRMIRWRVFKELTKSTYCLKTDEEDDQIRDHKTIDLDHVQSGDGWRGWNKMIRWRVLKQLTKLTYWLTTEEEDDQIRGHKTFDPVHVRPPGHGWRRWDRMIRWRVFK